MVVAGVTAVLEVTGGLEGIEHGLNAFMEGIPVLMNALDEVAKLHPFVGGRFDPFFASFGELSLIYHLRQLP